LTLTDLRGVGVNRNQLHPANGARHGVRELKLRVHRAGPEYFPFGFGVCLITVIMPITGCGAERVSPEENTDGESKESKQVREFTHD